MAPLWEPATHCANVRGAPPSTVLPTPRTFHVLSPPQEPSNGMGTTLGRGPDLDQIKTPACRTLGTPHVKCRGRYPLQEPPFRLLELPGRRCDLRKAKDDTQDDCTPDASLSSAAQCTFYSILPLHAPDSGKTTTSPSLLYMYTAPPCVYKRGRRAQLIRDHLQHSARLAEYTTALLSPDIGTCLNHLAETWELPPLSRLACTPYYRHPRCKIVQCARTHLLDVRPRGRNQDKPARSCVISCINHPG